MEPFADYLRHDGTGLADLVRSRQVHPLELFEAAARRIEELNPKLNAVVYPDLDRAREEAAREPRDGPFAGVPFLVKDLGAAVAGLPYTMSSRSRVGYVSDADNEIVTRHRRAGLIILGKTNTPEFGLAIVTEPELHGPSRNPWNPDLTPGGSSGGSAVAVASGMVPVAHGNDGGGSIRMPASHCGLFGLKPTRGRSTWGPDHLECWLGLAEQHALTRSVRDSARLLDATQGPAPGAPYRPASPSRAYIDEVGAPPGRLRIAYTTRALLDERPIDPECVAAVESAARLCAELGHEVIEACPPLDIPSGVDAFVTFAGEEGAFQVADAERLTGRKVGPGDVELLTWIVRLIGEKRSVADLGRAFHTGRHLAQTMAAFLEKYDLLLTSTAAQPPTSIGAGALSAGQRAMLRMVGRAPAARLLAAVVKQLAGEILRPMPNTPLCNLTGQPAMSVPLHWTAGGLPVGVQFIGRVEEEGLLFRLASQLEAARPWWDRRPKMG
ncbi:MAG TPA: amidase [Acidimicrobiia bacterium]|nr:amidase [Acidimicrobiia bacterium]